MSDNWPKFLCYDARGIQSYIFKIPRLRYIIGGSALLDRFDRDTVPQLDTEAQHIFSAGGRGAFICHTPAQQEQVEELLLTEAQRIGLDLRLSCDADFSDAAHSAERLYPYIPDSLDGHPCKASGAYPVPDSEAKQLDGVHPVICRRLFDRGDKLREHFESRLLADLSLPTELEGLSLNFFHDVSPAPEGSPAAAYYGAAALGNRNRWAIVCMDGNDMGLQFTEFCKDNPDSSTLASWITGVSKALDKCSLESAKAGIAAVIRRWVDDGEYEYALSNDNDLILPIRPLVVGGDDLTVLCHVSYAFDFIQAATDAFSFHSQNPGAVPGLEPLWPATSGKLTISSGVLFAPLSYPLHTAIPYTESLLASAKHRGREEAESGTPSPSCIDWESVTESLLDTPAARRQRELRFFDEDIGEVIELTQRPYTMARFSELGKLAETLADIPASIRHEVLPAMRQGFWDRRVFHARLSKHQPVLAEMLDEGNPGSPMPKGSLWKSNDVSEEPGPIRSTNILDALLLLQEESRMTMETV